MQHKEVTSSGGCVFCAIVAGGEPGSVVYEDEKAFVLIDIAPVNPGHSLVIPKRHAEALADLEEATAGHVFALAMRTAAALRRSGLRCEGVNLFLADGEAAGQEVPHVHMHVVPRFRGDPFRLPSGRRSASRADLDAAAQQLRSAW